MSVENYRKQVHAAVARHGGDDTVEEYVLDVIRRESGGNPNARAKGKGQSAKGILGITNGYWSDFGRGERTTANEIDAVVRVTISNEHMLDRILARPVSTGDLYLAHFAGPGGARAVLNADEDTSIRTLLGSGPVNANHRIRFRTTDDHGNKVTLKFRDFDAGDLIDWAHYKMDLPSPRHRKYTIEREQPVLYVDPAVLLGGSEELFFQQQFPVAPASQGQNYAPSSNQAATPAATNGLLDRLTGVTP